jgi:hypothetical protein
MDGLFIVTTVVAPHGKFPRRHEHHRCPIFTGDLLLLRLRRACDPRDDREGDQHTEHSSSPLLFHPHASEPFRLATGHHIINSLAVPSMLQALRKSSLRFILGVMP